MQTRFVEIVKEALEAKCEAFIQLVKDAKRILASENGKVGKLEVAGRLVQTEPTGEALIIGDLHGDLESLIDIFKKSSFLQKMEKNEDALLIFLGDYGDRGFHSVETYYTVLSIKLLYPKQVVLIRGNHEGPEDLMAHPHDLPEQFQTRFGEKWAEAYWKIRALFPHLYNAVLVKNRYLLAHGGLSTQMATAEDLAYAHKTHPEKRVLEDLLWSDPTDATENTCTSPRGAGQLFGQKVTTTVLERFNVEVFIRGHEPCAEGFRIDHNGKILTLFSRKGPPYFNAYGAYLNIDFSMKPKHAENMIPWLHKF